MGQIITFGPSSIRARRRKPRSIFYDQAVSSNPAEKLLKEALVRFNDNGIEGESGEDAGSAVTAWRNSGTGGSSYDLTTLTAGTINPAVEIVNGRKAVNFLNKGITTASVVPIPQPFTVACAFNILTNNSQSNYVLDGITNSQCSILRATSDNTFRIGAGTFVTTGVVASFATVYPTVIVFNGTNSTYRIGASSGSLPTLGTAAMQAISMGRYIVNANAYLNGWVAEPAIWNRVLTSEEIDLILQHYTQQWA